MDILPTPSFAVGFISFPLHVFNVQKILTLCVHLIALLPRVKWSFKPTLRLL